MRQAEKERQEIKAIIAANTDKNCKEIADIIEQEKGKQLTQSAIRCRAGRMGITLKAVDEGRTKEECPPRDPMSVLLLANRWNEGLSFG